MFFSPPDNDCLYCGQAWKTVTLWEPCLGLIPGQTITTNIVEPIEIKYPEYRLPDLWTGTVPYCPGPNEKGSTMKGHVFSAITGDCIQCGSMWQTTMGVWGDECKGLIPGQAITTIMSDTEKDCDCQELLKGHNPECPYLLNKDLVD